MLGYHTLPSLVQRGMSVYPPCERSGCESYRPNGQNQWFQTHNPNSNPNGVLPGDWTPDTKVHGNGQPR